MSPRSGQLLTYRVRAGQENMFSAVDIRGSRFPQYGNISTRFLQDPILLQSRQQLGNRKVVSETRRDAA
jgi:hypothetical protein